MNVTLSLEDTLVRKVRKIAFDRDTTLTALIRDYLETVAANDAAFGRKRRDHERLENSFQKIRVKLPKRTWTRADLHERA